MTNKVQLYNTLTRKIEAFVPFNPNQVKIYTCGPTVYSRAHIGNLAAYIYWDLLVRVLEANDYQVKRILNLTDVGHLSSDGDEGEDKLEKGARKTGKSVWGVAEEYIETFQKDFRKLNLKEPAIWARATDYIKQDEELVERLREQEVTYETHDGIYFDTSKFPHYADFARLDLAGLQAGKRVDFSSEKRNPSDFAVWKFIQPGEKHDMRWHFLGHDGYPGWHLEYSSIIHAELGETIDIHTGGIDHIPVHHSNEIAQSEVAFEKHLAKYWLHCNHLTIDGEKISKSLGNVYAVSDLEERGFSPMDFKMWVLQGHYQSERNFSFRDLEAARKRRLNWRNLIAKCYQGECNESNNGADFATVLETVNHNLNSAEAIVAIEDAEHKDLIFWRKVDQLFGLNLLEDAADIDYDARKMIADFNTERAKKNYQKSDQLREQLAERNLRIIEQDGKQYWQYIK